MFDTLTADRNRGSTDPTRHISRSRAISREEALSWYPELPSDALTGGVVFSDGQIHSPARLALSFVHSAVKTERTAAANYVAVHRFLVERSRVVGVEAEDTIDGERFEIRARTVLNATGPWAAELLQKGLGLSLGPRTPTFSRDLALVTRRRLHQDVGLACPIPSSDVDAVIDRGGRHLFLLPWRGLTLVGVWHKVHDGSPDHVPVRREELDAFVQEANEAYPGLRLEPKDICEVLSGLVLFGSGAQKSKAHRFGKRSLLIDHEVEHNIQGLISLVGVRATVARRMAQRAVDLVYRKLTRPPADCHTERVPVHGGDFTSFAGLLSAIRRDAPELELTGHTKAIDLAHNYGSEYGPVVKHLRSDTSLAETVGNSSILRAEVAHAVRDEMAIRLEDVVFRRTDLATGRRPTNEELSVCARIMAQELDWNDERVEEEVARVGSAFELPERSNQTVERPNAPPGKSGTRPDSGRPAGAGR